MHVGSVNLRADLVKSGRSTTLAGAIAARTTVIDGREVSVIDLRIEATPANSVARTGRAGTMIWTPSTLVRDVRGSSASPSPVVETGPLDRDA